MSSYGSNKSGYLHPQQVQQAPYPTTPGLAPQAPQSPYYPTQPQPNQQMYGTSPTSQPFYSSSPTYQPSAMAMMPQESRRRSSSYSQHRPSFSGQVSAGPPPAGSMPIPIRQPNPDQYQYGYPQQPLSSSWGPPVYSQQQPMYPRSASHSSHHSYHGGQMMHDPHAYADGEEKYEGNSFGRIDEATEREYEKRYAREKAMERRPTLGGSMMALMGKIGRLGSERR